MNNRKKADFELCDMYLETNVTPYTNSDNKLVYQLQIYPGVKRFGPNRIYSKAADVVVPFLDPQKQKLIYDEYGKVTDYDMCPDCGCELASLALEFALNDARCAKFAQKANDDSSKISEEVKDAIKRFENEVESILKKHGYSIVSDKDK